MEEVEVVKEEEIKKPLKKTTDLMKAKIDRLMANPVCPSFYPCITAYTLKYILFYTYFVAS